jgi:hypothetical protein
MGILDEAIKEHLELKRRHGAGESELQQLEDEAFGLPTRPGEPDFPERPGEEGEPPPPEPVAAEAEPTAMEHPVVEPPADVEALSAEDTVEGEPVAAAPEESAFEGSTRDEAPPPATEEPEPTQLFDQRQRDELGLDELELELEEQMDADLGDLDTVERDRVVPEPDVQQEEGDDEAQSASEAEAPGSEEEEDVLEETPEFLQDRPEDDELWFEQGKPKDFDF